jgi:hypothetical protein
VGLVLLLAIISIIFMKEVYYCVVFVISLS